MYRTTSRLLVISLRSTKTPVVTDQAKDLIGADIVISWPATGIAIVGIKDKAIAYSQHEVTSLPVQGIFEGDVDAIGETA